MTDAVEVFFGCGVILLTLFVVAIAIWTILNIRNNNGR